MNKCMQLLLTAALPAVLSAGTISIGTSTDPVTFTPAGNGTGTIAIGTCTSNCVVDGVYNKAPISATYLITSTGTLAYSGGPNIFDLSGNTSSFGLLDTQMDSVSGSVAWNTATEGATTTDLNGTLTFGTVSFASPSDPLALAAAAKFGALPATGQKGTIDLIVNCAGPCITTTDPVGQIVGTAITFAPVVPGSAVPEPGTLILPGLALGFMMLRRR